MFVSSVLHALVVMGFVYVLQFEFSKLCGLVILACVFRDIVVGLLGFGYFFFKQPQLVLLLNHLFMGLIILLSEASKRR